MKIDLEIVGIVINRFPHWITAEGIAVLNVEGILVSVRPASSMTRELITTVESLKLIEL